MASDVKLNMGGLNAIKRNMPNRINAALQKMAQDASGYAIEYAPFDTGALRTSIKAVPEGEDWLMRDGVEYGVHQEFGTTNMAAQPFFLPAVRSVMENLPKEILAKVVTP